MVLFHLELLMCNSTWVQKFFSFGFGRGKLIACQARSPDLSPLDFSLTGYVKNYVILVQINTLSHIKGRIEQAIAAVGTEIFKKCGKSNL